MQNVILVIHLLLAIGLVGVVLLQRSEGGGLGIGGSGGGGGMGGFMTGRATADLLTRTTAILATAFMITSLVLAIIAAHDRKAATGSILDQPVQTAPESTEPAAPAAPIAK
ncbi:MAG: preprotein translocase subunit SecG [Alphaproteobacteria bacterium]|nr:preprotein translocase subunit SecG [Rhodospirillaceae bacterium]HCS70138.1 preprotein translocase subunit SecG [Rhodospirillaceae bacterium]|tara:strand:+ start:9291 stop:9623 length:333 start_codon:yes stop_codon:yes gene_type:complete